MQSIREIIRKLISWAETDLSQHLLVARPHLNKRNLPPHFTIAPHKPTGERIPIRGKRNAGYRLYAAEWPEDHLHELTAPKLICVTKGITDYIAGKYIITCGMGNFILVPPFTANVAGNYRSNLIFPEHTYCELIQILLGKDDVGCMYTTQTTNKSHYVQDISCSIRNAKAHRLFSDFINLAQQNENYQPQLQKHLLSASLWMLLHEIEEGHEFYPVFKNRQITSIDQNAPDLVDYIKENLHYSLTIEKVAQHLYMSPRQFTRYLRKEFNQSFVELLNNCRLEEAKRFLTETNWTIDGITWMVGFKSAAYFNTFFRRHMGCTPGTYRKKNIS